MLFFKKVCIWSLIVVILYFGSHYYFQLNHEKQVTGAEFLNEQWEIMLPLENEELYYRSEFIWKGEGIRYYVLQYNTENLSKLFSQNSFEKISELNVNSILERLYPHYEGLDIPLTYLPNSKNGEYYYYNKTQSDNDQLHMFLCKNSILNESEKENLLFIFEILY